METKSERRESVQQSILYQPLLPEIPSQISNANSLSSTTLEHNRKKSKKLFNSFNIIIFLFCLVIVLLGSLVVAFGLMKYWNENLLTLQQQKQNRLKLMHQLSVDKKKLSTLMHSRLEQNEDFYDDDPLPDNNNRHPTPTRTSQQPKPRNISHNGNFKLDLEKIIHIIQPTVTA